MDASAQKIVKSLFQSPFPFYFFASIITIRFTCSSCQANLKAKDKYSGRTLNCPACNKQIIVPVDYYKILGLVPNANSAEINAAYRKLAMQYHPDHNPNDNKTVEKFKLCGTAYETLRDSVKRAEYDRTKPTDVDERTTAETEIFSAGTPDTVRPSLTILALLKKAESGDAKAMRELSMAYLKGKGVEANFDRAFYWTEKAAQLGDAESQYELAGILRSTKKDNNKAFYWEQLSAEQGWAPAQYNLRVCFRDGLGIQPNPEKQFFWYQKAAENGLTEAKLSLAVCYLRGTGIAQDFQQALIWLHMAADDGNAEAKMRLGAAYIQGVGCSKDIQNGLSLLKAAAALGDKKAEDLLVSDEVLDITDTKDANDAQLARFKVRLKNKRAVMIGGCIVGALFGTAGGFMGFLIGVYLELGLGAFKEALVHELKFFFSSAGRNFVKESIVEGGIEGLFTSILGGMLLTSIIIIPKLGIIALFCPIIAIADIVKLQKELTNAY